MCGRRSGGCLRYYTDVRHRSYYTDVRHRSYDTTQHLRPCVEDGEEGVVAVELEQTMPDDLHAARCVGTCLVQNQRNTDNV